MNHLRQQLRIHIKGANIPDPILSFSDVVFSDPSVRAAVLGGVEASLWKEPTPVQMQALSILAAGEDLIAASYTGSGKTGAFLIPLLASLRLDEASESGPQALILAPTRELCDQIQQEAVRLSRGSAVRSQLFLNSKKKKKAKKRRGGKKGSESKKEEEEEEEEGEEEEKEQEQPHLLISTPMALSTLSSAESLLSGVRTVVLDEVDKLFEDSFSDSYLEQVNRVLSACPPGCQKALFSATVTPKVEELAASLLAPGHRHLRIGSPNATANIHQKLEFVGSEEGKMVALRTLMSEGLRPPVLLFVQSKERAKELFEELVFDGLRVGVVHSDLRKEERATVVQQFRSGELWVLIATDLLSRGLDFPHVNLVVNYDLPQSAVKYIHRVGRTGRGGRSGSAVTFFTERDIPLLRSIANVMRVSGCEVPDWMLSIPALRTWEKRKQATSAPRRKGISTRSISGRYPRRK